MRVRDLLEPEEQDFFLENYDELAQLKSGMAQDPRE